MSRLRTRPRQHGLRLKGALLLSAAGLMLAPAGALAQTPARASALPGITRPSPKPAKPQKEEPAPPAPAPAPSSLWQRISSPDVEAKEFPVTTLHAAFAASATQAWAVGDGRSNGVDYEPLIEQWNGSSWAIASGAKIASEEGFFNGISGTGASNVWIVGEGRGGGPNAPVAEHWNGTSWSVATLPAVEGGLAAVSADGASDAWAVGSTIEKISGSPTSTSAPLIEHYNGSTWSVVSGAIAGSETESNQLVAVDAITPSDVWALDVSKPRARYGGSGTGVVEHYNGSAWSVVEKLATGSTLAAISATSPTNVWAVGSTQAGAQLIEHFNGTEWSPIAAPSGPEGTTEVLTGVLALGESDVWAIGGLYEGVDSEPSELSEQWNGGSWKLVPTDSPFGASALAGVSGGPLFAVGGGVGGENRSFILENKTP